jgi:hypothetical protein
MRGGAGRIELDAEHPPREPGARDLLGRRVVGEVKRHQRLECAARIQVFQRAEDALAVVERLVRGAHRRLQVGHDDGAREAPRRVADHARHGGAVAQVQVPVVGALERDAVHRPKFYLARSRALR